MNILFDYFGHPEKPDLTLCYLDDTPVSSIIDPENIDMSFEFLSPNEISFRVYAYYMHNGEQLQWDFYNQVDVYRQVFVKGSGYYVITRASENRDTNNPYKDITALSCEITLGYKNFVLEEGSYLLYNPDNPKDTETVLGRVMEKIPNWKLGTIDDSLYNVTRFLNEAEGNMYDFLRNTVEERYACIFQFDILEHVVSVIDQNRNIEKTEIYLSYDNFIESISLDRSNSQIVTALRATGGDGISIDSVNPIGGSVVYKFDYFKQDMPNELWDAVVIWNQKIEDNRETFSNAVLQVQNLNSEIAQLKQELIVLESEKSTYEQIIELRKESGLDYSDIQESLDKTLQEIQNLTTQIDSKEQQKEVYQSQYLSIQSELAFKNNFTSSQILQLDPFIIYGEFKDDNIIVTDNMSYEDKQKQSQQLYDRCVKALSDALIDKGSFEVDSRNFLFDKAFKPYADKLKLGSQIYIEDHVGFYTPYLLVSYDYSYDDDNISLSFSNLGTNENSLDTYAKLYGRLDKATSLLQNSLSSKADSTLIDQLYDDLKDIKGQAEAILQAGELTVKRLITEYISVQNAKTPGATIIDGGNITTGILKSADGKTFFLDLINGILKMDATALSISGNTVENIAQEAANKELEDFADAVTSEIGNLQSQIDGQVQTWFDNYVPTSSNAPANMWVSTIDKNNHLGDLFYIVDNPDSGGRAYRWALVNGVYKWILIEDEDVAKALADAAKAQDTADGKRRVFVSQPTPPYDVGDLWAQGEFGDLMRCRMARESGSYFSGDWEKASKYTDNSALNEFISGDYADTIKELETQVDGKAETWYQSTDPSLDWQDKQKHIGDIWYNTSSQKSFRWTGYVWDEFRTSPPEAVFDAIDGKAQIFVTQPTPPYAIGDLWIKTDKSLYRCNNDRKTGYFNSDDWEIATKYIDSDQAGDIAQGAVDGMTQDDVFNKLTNNGQTQGFYIQDGKLYINAEYVKIINLITDHLLSYGENYSLESKNGQIYLYHGDYSRMRLALYYLTGDEFNYDNTFGNIQIWKGKVDKSGNLLDDNARYTYLTADSFMLGGKRDGTYLLNISDDGVIHGKNRTWIENSTGRWVFAASDGSVYNGVEALKEQSAGKRMIFRGTVSGTCYLGTTSFRWNTGYFTNTITQSDLKDKENISIVPNAKDFVMGLSPISYTLKNGDSGRTHMGFGAQDVAKLAKECNMGDLALYQAGVIDEEGNESYYDSKVPDERLSWGLNYHEFIAPIVATIQEQQKEIEALKKEINEIKAGMAG